MKGFRKALICLILAVVILWQQKVFAADVFCKVEYYVNGTNNMQVVLYSKTNKSYYVKGFTRDSDRQLTVYFSDKKTFSSESNSVLIPQSMFILPVRVILMPSDGSLLFSDIKNSPYKDHILFLASIGKIDGYKDGTFKPKNIVTRQEFVKFFVNVFDIKIEKNIRKYSFSDIQNCWAKSEIETLYKMGIITGIKDKQNRLVFKPNDGVTYEQAFAILARYLKFKSTSKNGYKSWANQYINAFVDNRLINADEIKGLKLNSFATREWVAYILSKAVFK
jgi:hypothetical protein